MAGFQTHISVSCCVGAAYAWWGHEAFGLTWATSAIGGGLCGIAGMLPDLDSDSGVPARETIGFAAAVIPMLLVNRLHGQGIPIEALFLIGAPLYLLIRFGVGGLLKLVTIHRGMFHSLPAAIIAGLITFLVCDHGVSVVRYFKAGAVTVGYLTHLVLDEIWSVEVKGLGPRLKSSFGTALKLFGNNAAANMMCYSLLILLGLAAVQERASIPTRIVQGTHGESLAAPPRIVTRPRSSGPTLEPRLQPTPPSPQDDWDLPPRRATRSTPRSADVRGAATDVDAVDVLGHREPDFNDEFSPPPDAIRKRTPAPRRPAPLTGSRPLNPLIQ
jgi:membrane-bound metal-dependent hydrolase YbcI (DUF457 family)